MKNPCPHAELIHKAKQARRKAYAPYSQFAVGAALCTDDGSVYCGVNVENCSYGLTICAERNAIAQAVLAGVTPGTIKAIAIVADGTRMAWPCGACRQVLFEFLDKQAQVVAHNLSDGKTAVSSLGDLFPNGFGPQHLPESISHT